MHKLPSKKINLLTSLLISCTYSQVTVADPVAVAVDTVEVEGESTSTDVSTIAIDAKDIERLNPSNVQELFRATPEVQVGSSLPVSQKVYVNGIEETNLSVTIDGARQNNKLFHHAGTNIIDPQLLKAVAVNAGVAPADAGPGALGGSIVYETKDVSDLLVPGDNFGGMLGLQYNENGNTFSRDISLYGRLDNGLEGLVYLKQSTGNDFKDGDGDRVNASEAALTSGLFKIGYLHESGYRAKVSYERVDDDADRPFRANFAGISTGDNATRDYRLKRETITFSIKDETPQGIFNPYMKLANTETDLRTGDLDRGFYESFNATFANQSVLSIGTLDFGFDLYNDSTKGVFPGYYTVEEEAENYGVFAQARLTPTENTRLSFGARYDNHELEGADANHSESDNSGLSSNISGELDITNFITASAGYSHVFAGAQLAEPYIISPSWVYPNNLNESKADNTFIGVEFHGEALDSFLSHITLGAKYFKTDIKDIRDEQYGAGPDNYSDVETEGYQVNGRYDWQSGFVRVSYMDVDTEIDGFYGNSNGSTENPYVGTPIGRSFRADFTQSFDNIGVSIGADVQHYFDLDGDDLFSTPSRQKNAFPSYTVANAFVAYTPQNFDNLTVRLSVLNMFDESYADRATYAQEYTETYDTQILQQPGRSFVLSARLKF